MNIYIIRHGDDDERYRGGWSNLPLIEEGIKKCEKLADYMYSNNIKIDRIVCSDLKRAKMTAQIIADKYGMDIIPVKRLRENNNGIFAGMLNSEAEENYPHCHFGELEYDEAFPGGESPKEFFERIKKDFFELIEENSDVDNLVIVTHGGVISIVRHILNNMEWSNKNKGMGIKKTSITKLVRDNKGNYSFEYENMISHLEK